MKEMKEPEEHTSDLFSEYTAVKARLDKIDDSSLVHDEGNDYTLKKDQISCWITVDNLSVYVHRTDEGVVVDIFPRKEEDNDPIASCYAFFNEGEPVRDL